MVSPRRLDVARSIEANEKILGQSGELFGLLGHAQVRGCVKQHQERTRDRRANLIGHAGWSADIERAGDDRELATAWQFAMAADLAAGSLVADDCRVGPASYETRDLMGAAQFASMRSGVIFVNGFRGAIVQEPALLEALDSGQEN